jgi:hypothetical protein
VALNIFSKQFFSNYIFHPNAEELSPEDQRKALITSLFLGVITFGFCHLFCLIKYRNRTFKLAAKEDPDIQKIQKIASPHLIGIKKTNTPEGVSAEFSKTDQQVSKDKSEVSPIPIKLTNSASSEQEATKETNGTEDKAIAIKNPTFNPAAIGDSDTQKIQIVASSAASDNNKTKAAQRGSLEFSENDQQVDTALQNKPGGSSISMKPTNPGSTMQEATKGVKDLEEEVLDTLTKSAKKEEDAYLIDFSKIKPSNIFKVFNKGSSPSKAAFGDVEVSDRISYDESDRFTQNFPFKYSLNIVTVEKDENGYSTTSGYMFTMNNEGKTESYGRVFDNFCDYLEARMTSIFYEKNEYTFKHFDFHSVLTSSNGYKKLRKKSSAIQFK